MLGVAFRTVFVIALTACLVVATGCTSTLASFESPQDPDSGGAPVSQTPDATIDPPPAQDTEAGELVRVIDGDSIEVNVDGVVLDIRMLGYNAPELYRASSANGDSASNDGRDTKSCNGEAAKAALIELVGDGRLELVGRETDRFGRRLADVLVDGGVSVRTEMIEQGWGLAVGGDQADRERMKQAATERRGLWGSQCGEPLSTALRIGETQANPPGPDGDNLNEEWIRIVNQSSDSVALEHWVVRDDTTGHRFELAGVLDAGATLTVRTGSGRSTESDFYLGETFPVWSNEADSVLLVDPDGVVAHWAFIN
ncbi:MAG: lamin tail domain-containing protein [Acidimicrobiales bacterium]